MLLNKKSNSQNIIIIKKIFFLIIFIIFLNQFTYTNAGCGKCGNSKSTSVDGGSNSDGVGCGGHKTSSNNNGYGNNGIGNNGIGNNGVGNNGIGNNGNGGTLETTTDSTSSSNSNGVSEVDYTQISGTKENNFYLGNSNETLTSELPGGDNPNDISLPIALNQILNGDGNLTLETGTTSNSNTGTTSNNTSEKVSIPAGYENNAIIKAINGLFKNL